MRDSASLLLAIALKSSGCSPQYEEYSRMDVPDKIKEGAVSVERSPVNVAMDFKKLVHVAILGALDESVMIAVACSCR